MREIGITTTIPIEIIYSSGAIPVDLNNVFITSPNPNEYVDFAEKNNFPRTTCSWIKGLYTTALKKNIREIISVMEGDCSNTHALSEVWFEEKIKIIPFSYPFNKDINVLKRNFENLFNYFKVNTKSVLETKKRLDKIRKQLKIIDILTYEENIVSGFENHYFLVSSSDFQSNPNKFQNKIKIFIDNVKKRKPFKEKVRLGFIGVPPIIFDLYEEVEKLGARIVFNEVQRQFAMLNNFSDIFEQYLNYTYPYSVYDRIKDIKKEIEKREVDGIIHYTQTFCFRSIQDKIFRKHLNIPILTLEGDRPCNLEQRNKIRLESFIDMLLIKKTHFS